MKKLFFSTLACLILGLPATAATLYECKLREAGNSNWIPTELIVLHDESANSAEVHDAITYHYNKQKPLQAEVSASNKQRVTFVWELRTQDSRNQNASMLYRATYVKGRKRMNIVAVPGGYANGFQGHGTCALSKR